VKESLPTETLNQLSGEILDAAISVHREMGPGLVESVYQYCLVEDLCNRQVKVGTMVSVMLHYKGELLNKEYIIDVLVEDEIII
jgi:GxxExxY protein